MTATSTSPTATSTTSRSSTRAATRPTATRTRVRTRSGATAGTRSRTRDRRDGPGYNPVGGTQIGNTGMWVGDYTIQPENGGARCPRARVRPRPRPAGPLRHRGRRQRRTRFWTLMAQSRLDQARRRDRYRPADLGRVGQAPARLARLQVVPVRDEATLQLGPHEYNTASPQASSCRCRRRRSWRARTAGGGDEVVVERLGQRPLEHARPGRHPARRARIPDLPGELGHRGLRTRPVRLRVRRGQRRLRLEVHPRFDRDACGGQRHRRHERRLEGRDVRPVGVRRDHDRAAVPLHDRRRSRGARVLRRRHRRHRRRRDRLRRRCRGRRRRLDH